MGQRTIRPRDVSLFQDESGLLKFKWKVYVGERTCFREKILRQIQEYKLGGHSGIKGTYQRIQLLLLFWSGLKLQVKKMVAACPT